MKLKEDDFLKMNKLGIIKSFFQIKKVLLAVIKEYKNEAEKRKLSNINQETNQPTSKKPEWDKDGDPIPKGKKKKNNTNSQTRKRAKRKGSGNQKKDNIEPDVTQRNDLQNCPICNTDISDRKITDEYPRIIEDLINFSQKTIVVEEIQVRKWCPACKKFVSSVSELALPKSDIGIRAMVLSAYMWVVMALSLPNIEKFLKNIFRLTLSTSGISKIMIRLSKILEPVYDEIREDVRSGFELYADETGWRVKGVLWWLWIFANEKSAFYWPDRRRGSPVVEKVMGNIFGGILISDAWHAYTKISCLDRQTCMAHIFRKIRKFIEKFPQYRSILTFYVKLRKIIKHGEKLKSIRNEIGEEAFGRRLKALNRRLKKLLAWRKPNPILEEVIKKVKRQEDHILTFVEYENVPSHNNYGEYIIKKGILKRKISGGSKSEEGFRSYTCLQSIAQTCYLRKISFLDFLTKSLIHYTRKGRPLLLAQYEAATENRVLNKKTGEAA